MTTQLIWLGHGTWWLKLAQHSVLLDPFLDENPSCPLKAVDVVADHILVSHGHQDHVADVATIANRCGATVVAIHEIAEWFRIKHGVSYTIGMNIGGGINLPFGRVEMTQALHSSQLPDDSYGGNAAGFMIALESRRIYFACDTGLFGDMEWIGRKGIDLAVLPIGDRYTMGIEDSLEAIRRIRPKQVIPAHYDTWPIIAQDAQAWAQRVRSETEAEPIVLTPGGAMEL